MNQIQFLKPKRAMNRKNFLATAFIVLSWSTSATAAEMDSPPEGMPFRYGLGYELFQGNCAQCHGADLNGTDEGPPLLHGFYKPSHHADVAFYRAIELGSPQHHWNFGDMKPVEGVNSDNARAIVEFVRWYQRNAGLY